MIVQTMNRLPPIAELDPTSSGWGFYLCARKEVRSGRSGDFLTLVLQDTSGEIAAKIFNDLESLGAQFEHGDFVRVVGKGNVFNQRLELVLETIRRICDRDRLDGFREEDCIRSAPRPIEEMWDDLQAIVDREATNPWVRRLLTRMLELHGERLRTWPAAQLVHHAYRGGLLEHVLKMSEVGVSLAKTYDADSNLLLAGALLHDLGKLEELVYTVVPQYSVAGNLVGHITIGARMLHELAGQIEGFPAQLLTELEHLVLSHHGSREFGSPVEPMTVEAFILAAVDDLDAKIHQVRRHVAEDESDGEFTSYHRRLGRVLFKPSGR